MDAQDTTQSHEAQSPGTGAQAREGVRARAAAIRAFRCKNLVAVIEDPHDVKNIKNIGTAPAPSPCPQ